MTQFTGYEVPTPPQRRTFEEITHLWTQVFQMDDAFFAQESHFANATDTLVSVLIFASVSAVASVLMQLMGSSIESWLPPEYHAMMVSNGAFDLVASLFSGFFGTFLGFYVGNGLTYLAAKLLGGDGSFGAQVYLMSLFAVPLGILGALMGWIPCIGWLGAIGLAIYELILNVRMFRAIHHLTTGTAVAAVLLPGLIIGALIFCFAIALIALITLVSGGMDHYSGMLLLASLRGLL